jgi:hypothetical protein
MLSCKLLSTVAAGIKHLYFIECDGIIEGEPRQNSELGRAAASSCQIAKFILNNKVKASNSFLLVLNIIYQG